MAPGNHRLNIKNQDLKEHREKRERAIRYWKDRVLPDFLPPLVPEQAGA
jgi:hypothetical protein